MELVSISRLGNSLIATTSTGGTITFIPARGLWIPVDDADNHEDGAGESGAGSSGGGTNTPPGSVAAPVDDYPYPDAPRNELSPFRYSYRDCTDFVAWRINRDDGVTAPPWKWTWGNLRWQGAGGNGDAIGWRADWIKYGRGVDLSAAAGRIYWMGTSAGAYGHVAYVQSVSGGNMVVEEYNWGGTQAYDTRTIPIPAIDSSHSFLEMPT